MKKTLALLLVLAMMFALVACSGTDNTSTPAGTNAAGNNDNNNNNNNNNTPSDTPAERSSIAVCLASEPDTLDPALNSAIDGASLIAHLFSGLAKWAQDSNGNLVIVPDAAKELVEGVENADGTALVH